MVSADGTPLTIHGSAHAEVELEGEPFITDIVVVSPLTSEAILGLDFLQEHQATIDLDTKRLHLKRRGFDVPLKDPMSMGVCEHIKVRVHAAKTVELPPLSEQEVMASLEVPVEGVWLLQEAADKHLPVVVASALMKPTSTALPVRLLNPHAKSMTVYAGMTLATPEEVESPTAAVDVINSGDPTGTIGVEKQKIIRDLVEQSGSELSSGEKDLISSSVVLCRCHCKHCC